MDFDGLDANFDALNAYDEQLEGLEHELEALVMDIFLSRTFFLLHLAAGASLDTLSTEGDLCRYPSLEIGELQVRNSWEDTVVGQARPLTSPFASLLD